MHTLKRLKGGLLVAVLCAVAGGPWTPASALAQDAPPALDAQTAQPPDTVPPDIARPAGLAITAADAAGTVVAYPVPTATDAVDGPVPVACLPAPGSFFPIGTTVVTCTASDAANNAVRVDFAITVAAPAPPPLRPPKYRSRPSRPPRKCQPLTRYPESRRAWRTLR